jgi:hypothetical protein
MVQLGYRMPFDVTLEKSSAGPFVYVQHKSRRRDFVIEGKQLVLFSKDASAARDN